MEFKDKLRVFYKNLPYTSSNWQEWWAVHNVAGLNRYTSRVRIVYGNRLVLMGRLTHRFDYKVSRIVARDVPYLYEYTSRRRHYCLARKQR